ncbi:hypothetical protein DMA10_00220 [Streptomyces sp. WAC 01420]|nr:hypothetical protein DLM49_21065 [Streptomyces sp. WAC 01438]RSN02160.1 hypothetical protein DMA10_00220 [Streptomyces sp. WAC 01420]
MARAEALEQLRQLAQARALGRHVGSDRLIQVGLDALLAGPRSRRPGELRDWPCSTRSPVS